MYGSGPYAGPGYKSCEAESGGLLVVNLVRGAYAGSDTDTRTPQTARIV